MSSWVLASSVRLSISSRSRSAAPWKTGSAPVCPAITGNSLTWTRVRSLVADRARSRVRREDVGDGSAAEDGGAHRLDGQRCEEDPLARAQDDRVDHQA